MIGGKDPLLNVNKNKSFTRQFEKNLFQASSISDSYHTPHPGMPMLWMMLIPTWAMNTKKNCMKLKELSLLRK